MFGLLPFLLKLIDPVTAITKGIIEWQNKKLDAQTTQAKIEADEQIELLKAKQAVLIAESTTPVNVLVRAWLVAPPSIYIAKLFVWDKVLGWGSTDDLSNNLWWIVFAIYGFYFLSSSRILKRFG